MAKVPESRNIYEKYELKKEHFSASQAVEDIFRQGFVMGYCTACDERKRRKRKPPAG